jgi:hypothetical protein
MTKYKNNVCRGAYALGTACGHCEKCMSELEKMCVGDSKKYKDKLNYIKNKRNQFIGVSSDNSGIKFCDIGYNHVSVTGGDISLEAFNDLCIAWLCLYKPSVIVADGMQVAFDACKNS